MPDSTIADFRGTEPLVPVKVLRITHAEGENGVRGPLAFVTRRAHAHQHGAVVAAFELPGCGVEGSTGISHGERRSAWRRRIGGISDGRTTAHDHYNVAWAWQNLILTKTTIQF